MVEPSMSLAQRIVSWLAARVGLAAVRAVPVGRDDDGLVLRSGTPLDKNWGELQKEFQDTREAWRKNPLARRLIGLITAYCVGGGVSLSSGYTPLRRFIERFWDENQMALRVSEWSDELARSGELFLVLFRNPVDGMSYVRAIPASRILRVETQDGDYETELRYQEVNDPGEPETFWHSPHHELCRDPNHPVMLHYAVNRAVGAVRGESDLAPILIWLRRYSAWLEDRVRLNAGVRSFLWIVKVARSAKAATEERYRRPPEPGSIIVADNDAGESWEAVAPSLNAQDASADGRALRWMLVAGGPGTGLLDLGEGEDSNLATGQVMQELRRRFLRRRQAYLVWMLSDVVLRAYERQDGLGTPRGRRRVGHADVVATVPDISPEDNGELAAASSQIGAGLQTLAELIGEGETFRRMTLRLFTKFAGETLTDAEVESILEEGAQALEERRRMQEEQMRKNVKEEKEDGSAWHGSGRNGHVVVGPGAGRGLALLDGAAAARRAGRGEER